MRRVDSSAPSSAKPSVKRGTAAAAPPRPGDPDVLLDVHVERGALLFVLFALGPSPAHAVRVRFNRALRDLEGTLLADNPLFTRLELLVPGRRVELLVDSFAGYRARRQPMQFEVRLDWRSDDGRALRRTLSHDLAAWVGLRTRLDDAPPR